MYPRNLFHRGRAAFFIQFCFAFFLCAGPTSSYAQTNATSSIDGARILIDGHAATTAPITFDGIPASVYSWHMVSAGGSVFISPRLASAPILRWEPYRGEWSEFIIPPQEYRAPASIATCMFGYPEIAIAPEYGAAYILRYSMAGKLLSPGFFGGVTNNDAENRITCADHTGDGKDAIVLATRVKNDITVRVYHPESGAQLTSFSIADWGPFSFSISRTDLGGDGVDELMLTSGGMQDPRISIYRFDGSPITALNVFPQGFKGGVIAVSADLTGDRKEEIIVGAGPGGGQLRLLNGYGDEIITKKFFPLGEEFRGGIIPLIATPLTRDSRLPYADTSPLIALPASRPSDDLMSAKSIRVDIATQRLTIFSHGHAFAQFPISTGTWNNPTPIGLHAIANKVPRAYSRPYRLYMPWWMAIVPSGTYGLHELPEWADGTKEGENHLGERRSHGCVRLGVGPAKALYDWAEIGTPVLVQ